MADDIYKCPGCGKTSGHEYGIGLIDCYRGIKGFSKEIKCWKCGTKWTLKFDITYKETTKIKIKEKGKRK